MFDPGAYEPPEKARHSRGALLIIAIFCFAWAAILLVVVLAMFNLI